MCVGPNDQESSLVKSEPHFLINGSFPVLFDDIRLYFDFNKQRDD